MDDFILNLDNPYEFIGLAHYNSINSALISKYKNYTIFDDSLKNNHYLDLDAFIDSSDVNYKSIDKSTYSKTNYLDDFNDFEIFYNYDEKNKEAWLSNIVSAEGMNIYKMYYTTFYNKTNVLEFVNESILIEETVINNNKLSDNDKKLLFGIMSTARIGAQYWGRSLNNI